MNQLQLFLPCAAGVEDLLVHEVARITSGSTDTVRKQRGGVQVEATWRDALLLNLHSRLSQRVLVQLFYAEYRNEQDLYRAASEVAWEIWFTPRQSIKVEVTAQHSPLTSLNFAALKIKDAVCDRFRAKAGGVRPDVNTQWPDIRIYAHLTTDTVSLYIDTSGEALFKRGWREDKGEAPLKETLAAAMIPRSRCTTRVAAVAPSPSRRRRSHATSPQVSCGALRSKRCCPSSPMSGTRSATRPSGRSCQRPGRCGFSAATWRTAWSTSPSAMPNVPAWRVRSNFGAATPCSGCRRARCRA